MGDRSSVIDQQIENQQQVASQEAIAYFYCDRNEPTRRDLGEIFCALLKQLSSVPSKGDNATDVYSLHPLVVGDYKNREAKGFPSGRPEANECIDLMIQLVD